MDVYTYMMNDKTPNGSQKVDKCNKYQTKQNIPGLSRLSERNCCVYILAKQRAKLLS